MENSMQHIIIFHVDIAMEIFYSVHKRRLNLLRTLANIVVHTNVQVTSQSKTIYGLFLQFSLTLVKLITSLKRLLESRFDTN